MPRGDAGHARIGRVDVQLGLPRADPHPAIDHSEPVRHRRAGQKVGVVDETTAVSEVVHG